MPIPRRSELDAVRTAGGADASRPSRTFGSGRRCATDGCDTALSMYNNDDHCWQHRTPEAFVNHVYRRPKSDQGHV
jgi:hypothetical protein